MACAVSWKQTPYFGLAASMKYGQYVNNLPRIHSKPCQIFFSRYTCSSSRERPFSLNRGSLARQSSV
jgi:hypothetical protein